MGSTMEGALATWRDGAAREAITTFVLAAGNSNGDVPMLDFAHHDDQPSLRLLVLHDDDAEREFAYTSGADQALRRAGRDGWTVVSMRDDWATVF